MILVFLVLSLNVNVWALTSSNSGQCYVVLGNKPISITYDLDKEISGNITLSISNLRIELAPNSYFLLMFGTPPNDLYGIAVLKDRNGTEEYYVIRGSQNEWFNIDKSFNGNVTLYVVKLNKNVEVKVYVNNSLVGSLVRNTTLLSLKSLVLTLGNVKSINEFSGNVYLTNIRLVVDNKELIGFNDVNSVYRFFVNRSSIVPSLDRLKLICSHAVYATATITKTYIVTTIVTGTTTYTVTSTTTTTTTTVIPVIRTSTIYEEITKVLNRTLTSTVTSVTTKVTTKFVVVEYIPWHIVIPSVVVAIIAVIALVLIVVRK